MMVLFSMLTAVSRKGIDGDSSAQSQIAGVSPGMRWSMVNLMVGLILFISFRNRCKYSREPLQIMIISSRNPFMNFKGMSPFTLYLSAVYNIFGSIFLAINMFA